MKMVFKTSCKRFISCILSLMIIAGAFFTAPFSAKTVFAESVVSVSDEASLFSAVEKGGTVVISKNIRISKCLKIPKGISVILDLNGKILNRRLTECQDIGSVIRVEPGAELTVRDASKKNHGTITGGASWNGGVIDNNSARIGGDGGTYDEIQDFEPNATVLKGFNVRGNRADKSNKDIDEWINGLNY